MKYIMKFTTVHIEKTNKLYTAESKQVAKSKLISCDLSTRNYGGRMLQYIATSMLQG